MRKLAFLLAFSSLASFAFAADSPPSDTSGERDPESFRIEITGSSWILDSSGTLHSKGTVVDLQSDLGFEQQQPTFTGKLVFKPARKHRIVIEGSPVSDSGLNTIHRTITFNGTTYNVNETVKSSSDLNMIFGGYQYDLISRPAGHLGLSAGGIYISGAGTLISVPAAATATNSQTFGLPVAGAEGRVFPLPNQKWIDIDGGIRGMAFGSYGHYIEGDVNGGVWLLNHVAVQAGYRTISAQLQNSSNPTTGSGVNVQLHGPIFSLVFKW